MQHGGMPPRAVWRGRNTEAQAARGRSTDLEAQTPQGLLVTSENADTPVFDAVAARDLLQVRVYEGRTPMAITIMMNRFFTPKKIKIMVLVLCAFAAMC